MKERDPCREEKKMASPRKHYSAEIKAKVALEAIKGNKTANERLHQALDYRTPAAVYSAQ